MKPLGIKWKPRAAWTCPVCPRWYDFAMLRARLLAGFFALATASLPATSQPQTPQRPAYDGSGAPDVVRQIRVDQTCRILPDMAHPFPGKKIRPFRDATICSIEGPHASEHGEERIDGSQLLRYDVRVTEQTFVLQNISEDHVVFVVQYPVPEGWTVDSDPQPNRYEGGMAIFPVHAGPGEVVRLHVGMRRTRTLKPRTIAAN